MRSLRAFLVASSCSAAVLAAQMPTALARDPVRVDPTKEGAGSDEASQHFRAGVAFFKAKDFPAALAEFKRAYKLAPNYRVLFNLGQTSRELNDYATALNAFEEYLAEGGGEVPAARMKDVKGWIAELKKKVGRVTIDVGEEGAEIAVDDVVVGTSPLDHPIVVNAGARTFSATLKKHSPARRVVEITGGEESTVTLELQRIEAPPPKIEAPPPRTPAPAAPPSSPVAAWVMLSATGATTIVTAIMGGLALSSRADLDGELSTFPGDATRIDDAQSRTRSFALAADVLAGVSIGGAITTVVLFVVHANASKKKADEAPPPVSLSERGLGVRVSF